MENLSRPVTTDQSSDEELKTALSEMHDFLAFRALGTDLCGEGFVFVNQFTQESDRVDDTQLVDYAKYLLNVLAAKGLAVTGRFQFTEGDGDREVVFFV